jgi:putative spermidine/putrescine transport system permease protein
MTIFLVDPSLTTLPVILFAALRSGVNPSVAVASILLMSLTLFAMVIVDRVIGIERFIGLRKST